MTDVNPPHSPDDAFLQAQHGKKVPLTAFPGGPVIGEATILYDPEAKVLGAKLRIDDPEVAKMLQGNPSSLIFRQVYDPETQVLDAKLCVDDPEVAKVLGTDASSIIFTQGE